MKSFFAILCFLSGILLEILFIRSLYITSGSLLFGLEHMLFLHTLASTLIVYSLGKMLPKTTVGYTSWTFCFFFLLVFFLPMLGTTGLFFIQYRSLQHKKTKESIEKFWQIVAKLQMPERKPPPYVKPEFSAHGIHNRLRKMGNPIEHLNIVLATRSMQEKNAIPILIAALRNPVDDVRLLAFSLLEKKSVEINTQIESMKSRLNNNENTMRLHMIIGQKYLNMVTQGLVQDEMKNQTLKAALEHIDQVIEEDPGAGKAHYIMGEILLLQREVRKAESSFKRSLDLGFKTGDVNAKLAEVAFYRRRFTAIPEYLQKIPVMTKKYTSITELVTYWM